MKDAPKVGSEGKCQALKRATASGKFCQKPAGWGTSHPGIGACKLHGGSMPNSIKHAQGVMAAQAVELYGLARDVDPHDALLEELARTAGHVDWLRLKVEEEGEQAMVGPVGTGGSEGGKTYHPEYKPSVWLQLYQAERHHLVAVSATCIKAGIEERRVRVAEQQGQLIARVIQGILGDLEIDPELARPVVRKHLALIAGEAAEQAA